MLHKDWLIARGGDGSIEVKQAIERIEHLLVTNEFSDRVMDLRDGDTKTIRNLLAYRKVGAEGGNADGKCKHCGLTFREGDLWEISLFWMILYF
jgi:hypothetical protein